MQGWRVSMEDAHCAFPDVDGKKNAFFGVFDGHGGEEVAKYCSENIHKFILDCDAFAEGDLKTALRDSFMTIDQALTSDEVIEELKALSGMKDSPEDDVEEAAMLLEEANMPIEELLARIKDNVKEKLAEGGIFGEEKNDDEEVEEKAKEAEEKAKKEEEPAKEEEAAENGHSQPSRGKSRSRKQKQPVKRIEQDDEGNDGKSPAADEKKVASSNGASSGSSSSSSSSSGMAGFEGSAGGSVKEPLELDNDDDDADFEAADEDEDEESDSGEEDSEEDSDDEDEDEFEESEGFQFQQGAGEVGKDSGTTAIVALVHNNKLFVANVGDSRCVLCRNGASLDLSVDHKPEDEIEKNRIEAAGAKVTDDGRVNGGLNLTRALGDHTYKQNKDIPPEEQAITALPDITETELTKDDDFMVLACDGIWNVMTSDEVIDFVKERLTANTKSDNKTKLSEICEELFDRCIAPDTENDGTGCDNMTCMIVRFKHDYKKRELETGTGEGKDTDSKQKSKKAKLS